MQAGGSLQATRSCVCTRRHASALHSRVKTFDMAFRHLLLSESWRKVRHRLQMSILKMHLPVRDLFLS